MDIIFLEEEEQIFAYKITIRIKIMIDMSIGKIRGTAIVLLRRAKEMIK
ncbi:hypothetical protein [Enterococcus sp. BWR-S5]|nr:hypothetical protein [Enterococcus sp. BWR-S5]MBL1226052.1 hypothetical protein [Enterococcus sp. BWR-S5]